jgi:hypothetical protein
MSKEVDIEDAVTLRTFCHGCRKDINVTVPKAIIDNALSYPVSHAHLHGNPAHILILYVDSQYHIRGTELSETITVERPHKVTPLNAMVLLRIPPRYKRTAMAMLKLRQANAHEVAKITGKKPKVESYYLGSIFRLGYLERTRIKNYYQYSLPGLVA